MHIFFVPIVFSLLALALTQSTPTTTSSSAASSPTLISLGETYVNATDAVFSTHYTNTSDTPQKLCPDLPRFAHNTSSYTNSTVNDCTIVRDYYASNAGNGYANMTCYSPAESEPRVVFDWTATLGVSGCRLALFVIAPLEAKAGTSIPPAPFSCSFSSYDTT